MSLTGGPQFVISMKIEMTEATMFLRCIATALAEIFGKRLELCCPGGRRNAVVDQARSEGLHFGRLR